MFTNYAKRAEDSPAASSTPTPTPPSGGSSSPMRMGGPATTAVAIVVAVLLLLGVILISISEHRKKKRASVRDTEQALGRWEARQSVASFETVDDLKQPPPVATNMLQGRRFLFLSRHR